MAGVTRLLGSTSGQTTINKETMKTTAKTVQPIKGRPPNLVFTLATLALLAVLWSAPRAQAQLQTTMTISNLLSQGFTAGPAGSTVLVTGLRNGPANLN